MAENGQMSEALDPIHPVSCSPSLPSTVRCEVSGDEEMDRLAALLFPYHLRKYPGRQLGMCVLLGVKLNTWRCGRRGNQFGLPTIRRAEKIVAGLISELTGILDGLRKRREALELSRVGKSRGMLDVRVREPGGLPRNALWKGGRPKNLPPF